MMPAIFKKKPWNIIIAVLLVAVIGIGIYGTVFGIKEAVRQKKKTDKYNKTTTEQAVISDKVKAFETDTYKFILTEDFSSNNVDSSTGEYISDAVNILVSVESFEDYKGAENMTEREYLEEILKINGNPVSVFRETDNGTSYVEYKYNGTVYNHYFVFALKGEEAFYVISFIFKSPDKEMVTPYIINWAESFVPYK